MDELYRQVAAAARFVQVTRRELVPNMRMRFTKSTEGPDRVLRDMAVHNFASNLQLFADQVNELYVSLVELDKIDARGKRPTYLTIPELQDIGRMLVGG